MDKLQPPAEFDLRPEHGESTPRAVAVLATDAEGHAVIPLHSHRRGQADPRDLGRDDRERRGRQLGGAAGRGAWLPPGMVHPHPAGGDVRMRTVFVEPGTRAGLGADRRVIPVDALLRELIVAAIALPLDYAHGGRDERVMELILDEIERAPALSLHVPMPRHARLAALCEELVRDPALPASLEAWAKRLHMNARTLARLFQRETGMNFGAWCRQARLLLSLPRLRRPAPRSSRWRWPTATTARAPTRRCSAARWACRRASTCSARP